MIFVFLVLLHGCKEEMLKPEVEIVQFFSYDKFY